MDKGFEAASNFVFKNIIHDDPYQKVVVSPFVPPSHYGTHKILTNANNLPWRIALENCQRPTEQQLTLIAQLESNIGYSFRNKNLLFQVTLRIFLLT